MRREVAIVLTALLTMTASAIAASVNGAGRLTRPSAPGAALQLSMATIGGVVMSTDASTPQPIRHALVTLDSAAGMLQASTDDAGRFTFSSLRGGRYTLTAEKPAYLKAYYGSRRPGQPPGTPIVIADGASRTDLQVPLVRGAVITGTVRDEFGNPVASAQVSAMQPIVENGIRRFVSPPGSTMLATTDDRGEYRIYGLPPGEYAIRSSGGGGSGGTPMRLLSAAEIDAALQAARSGGPPLPPTPATDIVQLTRSPSWAPGIREAAQALTVTLAAGEERSGIDIASQLLPVGLVSGVMMGPQGPVTRAQVGIADAVAGTLYSSPGLVMPDATGRFSQFLPPGRWLFFGRNLEKQPDGTDRSPLFTNTEITVTSTQRQGFVVLFSQGSTISGRVALDGTMAPPKLDAITITLQNIPGIDGTAARVAALKPAADWSFEVTGVPAGRYRVTAAGIGSWALRSAQSGGRDILDVPLEIAAGEPVADLVVHLTDHPTEISGILQDQLGRPAPEYTVVVFPTDRALRLSSPRRSSGLVKLATDGSYRITGLPPGEYFLAAVTDADPRLLADDSFLDDLAASAITVVIGEGERKIQNLRIGGR